MGERESLSAIRTPDPRSLPASFFRRYPMRPHEAFVAVVIVGLLVADCATLGLTRNAGSNESEGFCGGGIAVTGA
jgi:hypothetical protein